MKPPIHDLPPPSELPDPEEPSMAEMLARWGADAATALRIKELTKAYEYSDEGLSDSGQTELQEYLINHNAYLNTVTDAVDGHIKKSKKIFTQSFSPSDQAFFAASRQAPEQSGASVSEKLTSPLDLEMLGLPPLETGSEPMGVLIRRHTTAEGIRRTPSIELLAHNPKTGQLEVSVLENMAAAKGGMDRAGEQWVPSGDSLLSFMGERPLVTESNPEPGSKGYVDKNILTLTAQISEDPDLDSDVRLIRAKPNKVEVAAAAIAVRRSRVDKFVSRIAAAVAAGTFVFFPVNAPDADANREITTAEEMVQSAGTDMHDGIEQAEQAFDENTLERSRRAFDAYFRGDTTSLQAQAEAYGYESAWMGPDLLAKIEVAPDTRTLETIVNEAFGAANVPITLQVHDTDESLKEWENNLAYIYEKAENLENIKQTTRAIVDLWNGLDRRQLQAMQPVVYSIVKEVRLKDPEEPDPAGYYERVDEGVKDSIILQETVRGLSAAELTAHETAHYFDLNQGRHRLSFHASTLTPEEWSYVGKDYANTYTTNERGWRITASPYGNANAEEDAAEVAMSILQPHPIISGEHSPLGEKVAATIFEMESMQPGFTASLLSRSTRASRTPGDTVNEMIDSVFRGWEKAQIPGGIVVLLSTLGIVVRAQRRQKLLREYGLGTGPNHKGR